jgi:hypothetical protein
MTNPSTWFDCERKNECTCLIGYIKALVLFANDQYLRVSAVGSSLAAQLDGNPPINTKELNMTLNVLAIGITRDGRHQIVEKTTSDLGSSLQGRVSIAPLGFDPIPTMTEPL